jgi:hypothetical protein
MWYAIINVLEEPAASIFKVEKTIKMTEVSSSKTKVTTYQATQYHKSPQFYLVHHDNLKTHKKEKKEELDCSGFRMRFSPGISNAKNEMNIVSSYLFYYDCQTSASSTLVSI